MEVTFTPHGSETLVTVVHSGFGEHGVPEVGEGYGVGQQEILAALAQWVQAGESKPGRSHVGY